jgi:hypothetical protein
MQKVGIERSRNRISCDVDEVSASAVGELLNEAVKVAAAAVLRRLRRLRYSALLAVELRVVDTCSGLPSCLAPFNRFDVLEEDLWSEKGVRRFKFGD